ncbi:MAG: DNA-3-methyladenine glycosylase [Pseudomonadota bacterium]
MKNTLDVDFYNRNVVVVAKELIGKILVFGDIQGIITETEAYRGSDDEASHAYKGMTKRNASMFGPPGFCYVYMIYGMYYCLNIVTEELGKPSAVLIRGLLLPNKLYLNGPGKLCRHIGINKEYDGLSLLNTDMFCIKNGVKFDDINITSRIGITKAVDKPWRFFLNIKEMLE